MTATLYRFDDYRCCRYRRNIAGELSKNRLLEAGARLALEHGPDAGLERVTFSSVAHRSGVPPSTLYTIWPTVSDYHADLFAELPSAGPLVFGTSDISDALARGLGLFDLIGLILQRDLEALIASPDFDLLVAATMTAKLSRHVPQASAERVHEHLREAYDVVGNRIATVAGVLMPYFGVRMRPGLAIEELVLGLTAIEIGCGFLLPIVGGDWTREWVDDACRPARRHLMGAAAAVLVRSSIEIDRAHPNSAVWRCFDEWPEPIGGERGCDQVDIDWTRLVRLPGDPPSAQSGGGRWSKDAACTAALRAGLDLARHHGLRPGLGWIKLSRLLSDLGLSSGAAHASWTDHEAFQAELATRLVGHLAEHHDGLAGAAREAAAAIESGADLDEVIRMAIGADGDRLSNGLRFRMQLALWRWWRSTPGADVGLESLYARTHAQSSELLTTMGHRFGRVPRPGLTYDDLAWVSIALAEGSAVLRWVLDDRFEARPQADDVRPAGNSAEWSVQARWFAAIVDGLTVVA